MRSHLIRPDRGHAPKRSAEPLRGRGAQVHAVRHRRYGTGMVAVVVLCQTAISACRENLTTPRTYPDLPLEPSMLTAQAAASLDETGHFDLHAPSPLEAEIDGNQAVRIASVWTKQFGRFFLDHLEKERGYPIDLFALRVCGAPMYAEAAYEPASAAVPAPIRRGTGAWWLVTMCDASGAPVLSLAVSALDTDVSVVGDTLRYAVPLSGNEVIPRALPSGSHAPMPPTPEQAAALVAHLTGRKVAQVPELIAPPLFRLAPQSARWAVTLDSAVLIHGVRTGERYHTHEVYVGYNQLDGSPVLWVTRASRSTADTVHYLLAESGPPPAARNRASVIIQRRPGYPIDFELATVR